MHPSSQDPNRTVLGGPQAGGVTQAMSPYPDPNRTQAISVQPVAPDAPPVSVQLLPSRDATMANGPAREQFLLELSAGVPQGLPGIAESGPRTPLNLCLVLDTSGSMEGLPLEYAKQSCNYVIDLLGPQDIMSIVTFEETVNVLMPPQRVTAKQPIKDGIARIVSGNTTNLYDALSLSLQQVLSSQESRGRATRMVVLTDGEPTAGIKDFSSLVNHAGQIKDQGVTITFLGFGPDYNEELLAAMAKRAGGNYAYIPRPEMIPEVFRLEVDKMLSVAATGMRLNLKMARWVNLRSSSVVSPVPSGNEIAIALPDLERGAVMQHIFDFDFPNHPLGHYRVATGSLSYENALTGAQQEVPLDFVMEFTADSARYSAPVNPLVAQAGEIAAASRTVERTVMGLKTGQLTGAMAVAELQKTQALLMKDGRLQEAQEVTMALRALQSGDQDTAQKTLMGTINTLDQGKR